MNATRMLAAATAAALVLVLGACATESGTSPTPTATPTPTPTPAPTPTPTPRAVIPGNLGGLPGGSLGDPCAAFNYVGQFGLGAGLPPGSSVKGSPNPSSDEARALGEIFDVALSQATGGNVDPTCFMEFRQGDDWGVWMAFALPGTLAADAATKMESALKSRGVQVSGTFNGSAAGQSFITVAVEGVPLGGGMTTEGALYIIGNQAIAMAGESAGTEPSVTPAPGGGLSVTPPAGGATTSGLVDDVDRRMRDALKSALGTDLTIQSSFAGAQGGTTVATISYQLGQAVSGNVATKIEQALRSLGVTEISSFSAPQGTVVTYQGLRVGDKTVSGAITAEGTTLAIVAQAG